VRGDGLGRRSGLGEMTGGLAVGEAALGGGELRVHRGVEDGVAELRLRRVEHDLRGHQLVRRPRGVLRRQVRQRSHGTQAAAAQHGEGAGDPLGGLREEVETVEHRAGDRLGRQRPHGGRRHLRALVLRGDEPLQHLHEQEGVASRGAVARLHQRGIGDVGERVLDEPSRRRRAERRRSEQAGPREVAEGLERPVVRLGLARADAEDHGDGQLVHPAGEVGEPAQGGAVGPVGVVDREEHGLALREVGHEPVEAVDEWELRIPLGGPRGQRRSGQERRRELGGARQRVRSRGGVEPRQDGLEELERDAEGELALELAPRRGDDLRSVLRQGGGAR
jgi:hypothetical protein